MKTPEQIAEKLVEQYAYLTLDDLGLSAEELMIQAIEADRAQRAEEMALWNWGNSVTVKMAEFDRSFWEEDLVRFEALTNGEDA